MLLITKLINRICAEVNISVTLFISKTQKQITKFILGMREQLQLLLNLVNVIFWSHIQGMRYFCHSLNFYCSQRLHSKHAILVFKKAWLLQTFFGKINSTNRQNNCSLCLH